MQWHAISTVTGAGNRIRIDAKKPTSPEYVNDILKKNGNRAVMKWLNARLITDQTTG